tara:strand:+ start:483 stop:611 length:129 start_codon:yes stop_codon:yes gene_type:complete
MFKITDTFWYRRLFLALLGSSFFVMFIVGFIIGFSIGALIDV